MKRIILTLFILSINLFGKNTIEDITISMSKNYAEKILEELKFKKVDSSELPDGTVIYQKGLVEFSILYIGNRIFQTINAFKVPGDKETIRNEKLDEYESKYGKVNLVVTGDGVLMKAKNHLIVGFLLNPQTLKDGTRVVMVIDVICKKLDENCIFYNILNLSKEGTCFEFKDKMHVKDCTASEMIEHIR